MQVRSNYTEIEDFLADESFQIWCSSVMTKKLGRMDLDPNRAKLVEEARLWLLAMKVPQHPCIRLLL
jgi:hypothetical protein